MKRRKVGKEESAVKSILIILVMIIAVYYLIGVLKTYNEDNTTTYHINEFNKYIENGNIAITDATLRYEFAKLSCPKDIFIIVDTIAQQLGLPTEIWYPIVGMESKFEPKTRSKTETVDARGLFGIDVNQYPEIDKLEVYQPIYNANFQITKLIPIWEEGMKLGLDGADLVYYTAHYHKLEINDEDIERYIKSTITKYSHELELATNK